MGFAAGATESTIPLIITDYTFLHERAQVFGLLSFVSPIRSEFSRYLRPCVLISSRQLVSFPQSALTIGASYEAVLLSWQWFYWASPLTPQPFFHSIQAHLSSRTQIFLILSGVGLVLVFVGVPETKFVRPAFSIDGAMSRVNEFGDVVPLTQEELRDEMDQASSAHGQADNYSRFRIAFGFRGKIERSEWKVVPAIYYQMAKSLLNPAIVWALGLASLALSIIIMQSLTWGNILINAYGWSPQSVGLNSLGAVPAGIAAFVCCGWGGDKISIWLARRNKGLHIPEHRVCVCGDM
jgi:hypothetical protein